MAVLHTTGRLWSDDSITWRWCLWRNNKGGEFPEIDYEADSFGDVSLNIGSGKEEFFEFFYRNKNSGAANLIHYAYDLCICPTHIEADLLALGKGHYSDEIEVPILDDEKTWLNR